MGPKITIDKYVCVGVELSRGDKMKMTKKNQCTECGSGQTYVRLETQDRVCRLCGEVKPLKSKPSAPQAILDRPANAEIGKRLP